uniref:Uncharacterized protein n=1 Tax=Anguilla anguilla TaxID=7936 RepID=A0A0E9TPL1_ANGAN
MFVLWNHTGQPHKLPRYNWSMIHMKVYTFIDQGFYSDTGLDCMSQVHYLIGLS